MKINKLGYNPQLAPVNGFQSNNNSTVSNYQPKQIEQLSNVYYTPLNFGRRWSEHKSWGAQIDPKTKDVNFKLFSFDNNQSVEVEIGKAGSENIRRFPMYHQGNGIYTSNTIPSKYAKNGTPYRYIIKKANGEEITVKDPYSYRQKKLLGESILYDQSLYQWSDKSWYKNNKTRVSRLADSQNKLTPVNKLKIYELNIATITKQGTLESAKDALKNIKNMGFNAIEVMPLEATYSYNWGYDGVDKFAPSEHLGGPDKLKEFVDYAHGLGLNVIIDMVPNHIGTDGNSLAITGPYTDGGNCFGDKNRYEGDNSRYVRDFIVNAAMNWIDNYHADGLRLDMTKFMESDNTMKQIAAEVNYHKPDAFLIAEDGRGGVNADREGNSWADGNIMHDNRVVNPLFDWEKGLNDDDHCNKIESITWNNTNLSNLGYDSEWDFAFFHELKDAIYGNVDLDKYTESLYQSQNRVKYVMSHDEIGNFEGTRLIAKTMVPMLSLNENVVLDENDIDRAKKLAELKGMSFDDAKQTVIFQKAQLTSEKLVKAYLTGKFDKYTKANGTNYEAHEAFEREILRPMGIRENSRITPELIKNLYKKSFAVNKMALAQIYTTPGPVMVFQGDESADLTPFRFFREFESVKDETNLKIEKGYDTGLSALNESKLGNIPYTPNSKAQMNKFKNLVKDLNNLTDSNPALTNGTFVYEDTVKHINSKVCATHMKDDKSGNEIYQIVNFKDESYPRADANSYYIKFPAGKWVEVMNTDDKKYGGKGLTNATMIDSNGIDNVPINLAGNSTLMFKKVSD